MCGGYSQWHSVIRRYHLQMASCLRVGPCVLLPGIDDILAGLNLCRFCVCYHTATNELICPSILLCLEDIALYNIYNNLLRGRSKVRHSLRQARELVTWGVRFSLLLHSLQPQSPPNSPLRVMDVPLWRDAQPDVVVYPWKGGIHLWSEAQSGAARADVMDEHWVWKLLAASGERDLGRVIPGPDYGCFLNCASSFPSPKTQVLCSPYHLHTLFHLRLWRI